MRNGPANHDGAKATWRAPSLPRVDDDLGVVQLRLARGGALVTIRFAARVARFVADRIHGAGGLAAGAEFLAFGAGAIAAEFYVPGFLCAAVAYPGDFVALLGMMLLVLGQDFAGVVDVELVRVLRKRWRGCGAQPHSQSESAEIGFSRQ